METAKPRELKTLHVGKTRTTTSVHDNTIVNSSSGFMLTNKLSIAQVIDMNKLRWFGLVIRREEESMLMVVMHS